MPTVNVLFTKSILNKLYFASRQVKMTQEYKKISEIQINWVRRKLGIDGRNI